MDYMFNSVRGTIGEYEKMRSGTNTVRILVTSGDLESTYSITMTTTADTLIATQPQKKTNAEYGSTVTLSLSVVDGITASYQWQTFDMNTNKWTSIEDSAAHNSAYSVVVDQDDVMLFRCIVTANGNIDVSDNASIVPI